MLFEKEFKEQYARVEKLQEFVKDPSNSCLLDMMVNMSYTFNNGTYHPSDVEKIITDMEHIVKVSTKRGIFDGL